MGIYIFYSASIFHVTFNVVIVTLILCILIFHNCWIYIFKKAMNHAVMQQLNRNCSLLCCEWFYFPLPFLPCQFSLHLRYLLCPYLIQSMLYEFVQTLMLVCLLPIEFALLFEHAIRLWIRFVCLFPIEFALVFEHAIRL